MLDLAEYDLGVFIELVSPEYDCPEHLRPLLDRRTVHEYAHHLHMTVFDSETDKLIRKALRGSRAPRRQRVREEKSRGILG